MPEVPKKPVPEKKVPVLAPKKVEPPSLKGTLPPSEYTVCIPSSTRKVMVELGVRKNYIYKTDSHIFTSGTLISPFHWMQSSMKNKDERKWCSKTATYSLNFIKHPNFHIAISQ